MLNLFSLLPGVLAMTRPARTRTAARRRSASACHAGPRWLHDQEAGPPATGADATLRAGAVARRGPSAHKRKLRFPSAVQPSRAVLDPDMVNQEIRRSDSFAVGPARYSLTARPGWLVVQSPRNGLTHFAVQIPFPAVNDRKTWLVPTFADLPQNTLFIARRVRGHDLLYRTDRRGRHRRQQSGLLPDHAVGWNWNPAPELLGHLLRRDRGWAAWSTPSRSR